MKARERVKTAFRHEEPDRVPIFELDINAPAASEILGRQVHIGYGGHARVKMVAEALLEDRYQEFIRQRTDDYLELYRELEFDIYHSPPLSPRRVKPEPINDTTWRYVDEGRGTWSIERYIPESDMGGEIDCDIKQGDLAGLRRAVSILEEEGPVVDELYVRELEYIVGQIGHEMFVLGSGIGVYIPLATCWADVFMVAMVLEPALAHRYLDLRLERTLALLDRMVEFNYEPPTEDILKLIIGEDRWEAARHQLITDKKLLCDDGKHALKRVAYDLQGGKWGTERCTRCGHEETWHA